MACVVNWSRDYQGKTRELTINEGPRSLEENESLTLWLSTEMTSARRRNHTGPLLMWLTALPREVQDQIQLWLYKNVLVSLNFLLYYTFYSHSFIHSFLKYLLIAQYMSVMGLSDRNLVMNKKRHNQVPP